MLLPHPAFSYCVHFEVHKYSFALTVSSPTESSLGLSTDTEISAGTDMTVSAKTESTPEVHQQFRLKPNHKPTGDCSNENAMNDTHF
jgi:hypothetical protein